MQTVLSDTITIHNVTSEEYHNHFKLASIDLHNALIATNCPGPSHARIAKSDAHLA
jgi:hypothetical protein